MQSGRQSRKALDLIERLKKQQGRALDSPERKD
jgi:hypothetical protein